MSGDGKSLGAVGNFLSVSLLGLTIYVGLPVVSSAQTDRADCIRLSAGAAVAHITYSFETSTGDRDSVQGSGVIIKEDGYLLTAAHVVRPPEIYKSPVVKSSVSVKVGSYFASAYDATVITKQDDLDVALVKLPTLPTPWPRLQVDFLPDAEKRTWLYALGFPSGGDLTGAGPGKITSASAVIGGHPTQWWNTDLPLNQGMSGGPVFNEYGEVAGLAGAIKESTGGTISYVIPIKLATLLTSLSGSSEYKLSPCAEDPKETILSFIKDAVQGKFKRENMSSALWQTIQTQTNGTGHYKPMDDLGALVSTEIVSRQDFLQGTLMFVKVVHANGTSVWNVGYNRHDRIIDASYMNPQPIESPPDPVAVGSFSVCIGEKGPACSGHQHLPCGTNIEGWAKISCRKKYSTTHADITNISDRSGNKCGYAIFDIVCMKP